VSTVGSSHNLIEISLLSIFFICSGVCCTFLPVGLFQDFAARQVFQRRIRLFARFNDLKPLSTRPSSRFFRLTILAKLNRFSHRDLRLVSGNSYERLEELTGEPLNTENSIKRNTPISHEQDRNEKEMQNERGVARMSGLILKCLIRIGGSLRAFPVVRGCMRFQSPKILFQSFC
jgi:hypothetical protein